MKKWIFIILSVVQMAAQNALAKTDQKLVQYFQQQLSSLNEPFTGADEKDAVETVGTNQQELWYFNQFSLRLRASVGFQIEGFTSFLIVPETEFVWQKGNPEGWANYRPPAK
ncbi:MAG: hypothetical protein ACXVCP_13045 [Bdellovibrio sp.]